MATVGSDCALLQSSFTCPPPPKSSAFHLAASTLLFNRALLDHTRLQAASPQAAPSRWGGEGEARQHKGGDGDGEHEAAVCVESVPASLSHQWVRAAADGAGSEHPVWSCWKLHTMVCYSIHRTNRRLYWTTVSVLTFTPRLHLVSRWDLYPDNKWSDPAFEFTPGVFNVFLSCSLPACCTDWDLNTMWARLPQWSDRSDHDTVPNLR